MHVISTCSTSTAAVPGFQVAREELGLDLSRVHPKVKEVLLLKEDNQLAGLEDSLGIYSRTAIC